MLDREEEKLELVDDSQVSKNLNSLPLALGGPLSKTSLNDGSDLKDHAGDAKSAKLASTFEKGERRDSRERAKASR